MAGSSARVDATAWRLELLQEQHAEELLARAARIKAEARRRWLERRALNR